MRSDNEKQKKNYKNTAKIQKKWILWKFLK